MAHQLYNGAIRNTDNTRETDIHNDTPIFCKTDQGRPYNNISTIIYKSALKNIFLSASACCNGAISSIYNSTKRSHNSAVSTLNGTVGNIYKTLQHRTFGGTPRESAIGTPRHCNDGSQEHPCNAILGHYKPVKLYKAPAKLYITAASSRTLNSALTMLFLGLFLTAVEASVTPTDITSLSPSSSSSSGDLSTSSRTTVAETMATTSTTTPASNDDSENGITEVLLVSLSVVLLLVLGGGASLFQWYRCKLRRRLQVAERRATEAEKSRVIMMRRQQLDTEAYSPPVRVVVRKPGQVKDDTSQFRFSLASTESRRPSTDNYEELDFFLPKPTPPAKFLSSGEQYVPPLPDRPLPQSPLPHIPGTDLKNKYLNSNYAIRSNQVYRVDASPYDQVKSNMPVTAGKSVDDEDPYDYLPIRAAPIPAGVPLNQCMSHQREESMRESGSSNPSTPDPVPGITKDNPAQSKSLELLHQKAGTSSQKDTNSSAEGDKTDYEALDMPIRSPTEQHTELQPGLKESRSQPAEPQPQPREPSSKLLHFKRQSITKALTSAITEMKNTSLFNKTRESFKRKGSVLRKTSSDGMSQTSMGSDSRTVSADTVYLGTRKVSLKKESSHNKSTDQEVSWKASLGKKLPPICQQTGDKQQEVALRDTPMASADISMKKMATPEQDNSSSEMRSMDKEISNSEQSITEKGGPSSDNTSLTITGPSSREALIDMKGFSRKTYIKNEAPLSRETYLIKECPASQNASKDNEGLSFRNACLEKEHLSSNSKQEYSRAKKLNDKEDHSERQDFKEEEDSVVKNASQHTEDSDSSDDESVGNATSNSGWTSELDETKDSQDSESESAEIDPSSSESSDADSQSPV